MEDLPACLIVSLRTFCFRDRIPTIYIKVKDDGENQGEAVGDALTRHDQCVFLGRQQLVVARFCRKVRIHC